jgi:uncharacterized protein YbcI
MLNSIDGAATSLYEPDVLGSVDWRVGFVDKRYIDDAVGATDAVQPSELVATRFQWSGQRCSRRACAMIVATPSAGTVVFGATKGLAALRSVAVPAVLEGGPTSARTDWCGENLLTVTLEDTLTPAERNLVKMNEHQRLRETRMFFQYATMREFCEPVEQITGRKVRSFISGIDTEVEGLSIEAFVLHPAGYDGPSRMDRAAL